jgi:hypothetical protein
MRRSEKSQDGDKVMEPRRSDLAFVLVRRIEYAGEIKALGEWAKQFGLKPHTLRARIEKWGAVEKAFTAPLRASR